MIPSEPPEIQVLFLAGCYKGETYDMARLSWLKRSLEDLSLQTLKPSSVVVSINSNIGEQVINVRALILGSISNALIFESSFERPAAFNAEAVAQLSTARYLCFWSDHDIHGPDFLMSAFQVAESSGCTLACPTIDYFYSDDNSVARPPSCCSYSSKLDCTPTQNLERFFRIDSMGATYGLWRSCDLKQLPFVEVRSLDFLWQTMAQMMSGCVYFEGAASLLSLREYRYPRGANHAQLIRDISPYACLSKGLKVAPAIATLLAWIHINIVAREERKSFVIAIKMALHKGVGFWNIKNPLLRELKSVWSGINKQSLLQKIASTAYIFDVMKSLSTSGVP